MHKATLVAAAGAAFILGSRVGCQPYKKREGELRGLRGRPWMRRS
jgi:hypothetical protein